MRLTLALLLLCALAGAIRAQDLGLPKGGSPVILEHQAFISANNSQTKFPDWVYYEVTLENVKHVKRQRNWRADPILPEPDTLEPRDYKGAHKKIGTDRGHMAPLATFKGASYWYEVNYLSNIVPQKSKMNQGVWKVIEESERTLCVAMGNKVQVYCGTLYVDDMPQLPGADEPHTIPSHFWKVVVSRNEHAYSILAFIVPQNATDRLMANYLVTVNDIESSSGLDLLHNLPDNQEERIESELLPLFLLEAQHAPVPETDSPRQRRVRSNYVHIQDPQTVHQYSVQPPTISDGRRGSRRLQSS